jgi:hypothetical protein
MARLPTGERMNFLLLARGASLEKARVLAVSADQPLINKFVAELTGEAENQDEELEKRSEPESADGPEKDWTPRKSLEVVKGGQD